MTPLKHILVSTLLLMIYGFSAKAQSTIFEPFEGATHVYTVSGLTDGWDYEFFMSANADGSGIYDDDLTNEFDIISKTGTVADGVASTEIDWHTGASLNVYYFWFKVTASNGCSNQRHIVITPQLNQFDLLSENIPVDNTVSCPVQDTDEGFDPLNDSYHAGATVLQFKVSRENGTDNKFTAAADDTYDWSFIPELTVDPDLVGNINAIVSVVEATKVGDRYFVSGDKDDVIVTVTIDNAPGYDLDVTLAVTDQQESNTNLSDSNPDNDDVTHTIQIMPVIDGMGGI